MDSHGKQGHHGPDSNTYWYLDAEGGRRGTCRAFTLRKRDQKRRVLSTRKVTFAAPAPRTLREDSLESIRVNRLTHLQEELENETRAWMRADIQAERSLSRSACKGVGRLTLSDSTKS